RAGGEPSATAIRVERGEAGGAGVAVEHRLRQFLELRVDRRVDEAERGLDQAAAACDVGIGDDRDVRRRPLLHASSSQTRVILGVEADRCLPCVPQAIERDTGESSEELVVGGNLAAYDSLRQG